jgi:hypothetical protein
MNVRTADYLPQELNEKEASLLSKIYYCLNDTTLFANDWLLKKYIT